MKVGFIGCGNMGGALARAVSNVLNTKVYIYDHNTEKSASFAKEIGAQISDSISIAKECDFIFLGVKPNVLPTVIEGIKDNLGGGVIVSMAAGVSLEKIKGFVGDYPTVRIMPNTPVAVGRGMISWCKSESVSERQSSDFEKIMSKAGRMLYIEERLIDAATAVAGCGPAFVYMFAEALADGGVECGLPRDKALTLAAETIKGAAEMLLTTGKHPGQLKDDVCSPGGSTIEGVHALENGAFRADTIGAVTAAFEKTRKLGK
ncbi:MAG: pyrroline-5-carboxylate reductase [Clostridia bacterium]|nr:pyrroline-5-carboxylate reductase [Clostridia bacterium]